MEHPIPTVAIFGGSFDPPHVAHAMVASWLRWTHRADEVWWVPSFAHPFGKRQSPWAERVAMCEAVAAALGAWSRVIPVEATLPTPTYTIATLDRLAAEHPGVRLRLVVGADVLADTPKWKEWARIEREYSPIAVGRPGFPTPEGAVDFPAVSSTEVRARVAAGRGVEHLVLAAILEQVRRLYVGPDPTNPSAS
jgi:nicotinate-nucleotide adenylyltransferase